MKIILFFLLVMIFLEPNGPYSGMFRLDNLYLVTIPIILIYWFIDIYDLKSSIVEIVAVFAIFLLSINFIISIFITDNINISIYDAYLRIFYGFLVGRFLVNYQKLYNMFIYIIYISIMISCIVLVLNIVDRKMFVDLYLLYIGTPTIQWRFGGFFDLPYTLAVWVVFSCFFIIERSNKWFYSYSLQSLLHLQGLLTLSKTYLLGIFILALTRNKKLEILLKLLIGCIIIFAIFNITSPITEFVQSQIGRNPIDIIVSRYYDGGQTSNIMIIDFYLGSFGLKPDFATDNGYFEVLYYFGIIGFAIFLLYIFLIFLRLKTNLKIFMLFLMIASFGSSAFAANKMTLMMWCYLGCETKRRKN